MTSNMANKSYVFRIYPTEEQEELINKTFGCCRYVYNYFLAKSIEDYKTKGKSNSCYDNIRELTQLKKELTWLSDVDSSSLQQSLKNLDTAYKNFFRRVKQGKTPGFPKFKKKSTGESYKTVNYNQITIPIKNNKIKIPKLGYLKIKQDRSVEGIWTSMTVRRTASMKYFVSICCKDVPVEEFEKTGSVVGIDLGLKDLAITSNGDKVPNPKYLRKSERKLKRLQHQYSRKRKGGKNREKSRIKLARQYEKLRNQRKDFLHKFTTNLVKSHDVICCEDLNVKGVIRNHNLAKSVLDASWSEFVRQLKYKCTWYGKAFVQIDRFYPSSQLCNKCGYKNIQVKNLSVRSWTCTYCGTCHDRDVNAVQNILQEGLRVLKSSTAGQVETNAFGEDVRLDIKPSNLVELGSKSFYSA